VQEVSSRPFQSVRNPQALNLFRQLFPHVRCHRHWKIFHLPWPARTTPTVAAYPPKSLRPAWWKPTPLQIPLGVVASQVLRTAIHIRGGSFVPLPEPEPEVPLLPASRGKKGKAKALSPPSLAFPFTTESLGAPGSSRSKQSAKPPRQTVVFPEGSKRTRRAISQTATNTTPATRSTRRSVKADTPTVDRNEEPGLSGLTEVGQQTRIASPAAELDEKQAITPIAHDHEQQIFALAPDPVQGHGFPVRSATPGPSGQAVEKVPSSAASRNEPSVVTSTGNPCREAINDPITPASSELEFTITMPVPSSSATTVQSPDRKRRRVYSISGSESDASHMITPRRPAKRRRMKTRPEPDDEIITIHSSSSERSDSPILISKAPEEQAVLAQMEVIGKKKEAFRRRMQQG
jgi:hypothetical protein